MGDSNQLQSPALSSPGDRNEDRFPSSFAESRRALALGTCKAAKLDGSREADDLAEKLILILVRKSIASALAVYPMNHEKFWL